MDTFSLIGFAVVTAILSCTVRQFNNAAGMNVALAGGAFILLSIIAKVSGVAAALSSVAASGGLEGESVAVIVKAIGIAYTTQIAAALCRDLGETALAVKTELIGRIMLMTLGNADGTCSEQSYTVKSNGIQLLKKYIQEGNRCPAE